MTTTPPEDADVPSARGSVPPAGRRRSVAVVAAALVVAVAVGVIVWWTSRPTTRDDGPRAAVEQLLDGVAAGDCTITHPVVTERMIAFDAETDCQMLKADAESREVEVTTEVLEVRMLPGGTEAEVRTTWSTADGSLDMWLSVIKVDGRWLVDGRVLPGEE